MKYDIKKFLALIVFLFLSQTTSSQDLSEVPRYQDFLKLFPNGYPKYSSEVGNSKSIGAYQQYLIDIGFKTINSRGKTIGFKVFFKNKNNKSILKTNDYQKDELLLWGSSIYEKIKTKLVYPSKAKNRNQTGKVFMYLSINTSGKVIDKYITISSGNKSLDNAVIKAIESIKKFPKAPFESNQMEFDVIIPVNFILNN